MNVNAEQNGWCLERVARPWADERPLREVIREQAEPASGVLKAAARISPSEGEAAPADSWPGQEERNPLVERQVRRALERLVVTATEACLAELHGLVVRPRAVALADVPPISSCEQHPERVRELGRLFAAEAPSVAAVKFGLSLLQTLGGGDDRELLLDLGMHEELTASAVAVLLHQSRHNERLVYQLARRLHGWGRIHAVERLADTKDATIRAWLLRDGFRNTVMNEHLAFECAMTGELHEALAAPVVDAGLLRGAADLFIALANGGPAPDLADYPYRDEAISSWLSHLRRSGLDLDQLTALDALSDCPELSSANRRAIDVLRGHPKVLSLIEEGIATYDAGSFERADLAALRRQIDTFMHCEQRVLTAAPDASHALYRMLQQATAPTIERALNAARTLIPLPATDGDTSRLLHLVVEELARFPARGQDFVEAAAHSSDARARDTATRTLSAWARVNRDASRHRA